MGQLLIRGLDDRLIQLLRDEPPATAGPWRAEHRAILESTFASERETFAERADRLRASIPPSTLDSADLIREDCDRDYSYFPDDGE